MSIIFSVRVKSFVVIDVNANIIAQPAAAKIPILTGSNPGRATSKMPRNPMTAEPIRTLVNFSDKNIKKLRLKNRQK